METVNSIFHGKLNILVNNAGGAPGVVVQSTLDCTPEHFSHMMALNFESDYHISQLAHPLFKASREGKIIFISSLSGGMATDTGSVYGPAKARNLSCELAKDNIRVNAVAPGHILTPLTEKEHDCLPRAEEKQIWDLCAGCDVVVGKRQHASDCCSLF